MLCGKSINKGRTGMLATRTERSVKAYEAQQTRQAEEVCKVVVYMRVICCRQALVLKEVLCRW